MKARTNLIFALLVLAGGAQSQSAIDQALAQVEANNKALLAEKRRMEVNIAYLKTGLALSDPEISFDWMKGFPASAGNQADFIAAQSFDFPTAYKYRRQVSDLKTVQTAFEPESLRKSVLLEAKLTCLHVIYLNKREAELKRRLEAARQFSVDYQRKLDEQDATILDVNKAKLQALNLETDLQLLAAERAEQLQQLAELNGGIPIAFPDTLYPPTAAISDFESLWQYVEAADPSLKYLAAQKQIGEAEVRLEKALLLPGFAAGYRYQGILGQHFHGAHLGLRIPIWENKKRLAYQTLQLALNESRFQQQITERYSETRKRFDKCQALRSSMEEYQAQLALASNTTHLNTALQAGQITALEYFLELTLYYGSADRYLELELAWQKALAAVMAFAL